MSATPQRVDGPSRRGADASAPARRILGMRVDATSYDHAADTICGLAEAGGGGRVCVATVHMVMEAYDDDAFRRIVNGSELVTPDGMPLVWALRSLGVADAERVYGPELLPRVCVRAAARGIPVGLYGAGEATLERLAARLVARAPGLEIALRRSPPFRPLSSDEEREVADAIAASGAGIVFVGLGCPKQERFMARHRGLASVLVGVGAAFDFVAGAKPMAPPRLQRAGLEWLFRLAHEPRRLWRRYAVHNPRFVAAFAAERLRRRAAGGRRDGPAASGASRRSR